MFVYWGGHTSGKLELICHTLYNGYGVSQFMTKHIALRSNPVVVKSGDEWRVDFDLRWCLKKSKKSSKISIHKVRREFTFAKALERVIKEPNPQIVGSDDNLLTKTFFDIKFDGNVYDFPCNIKSLGVDKLGVDKEFMVLGMKPIMGNTNILRQVLTFPHKHIVPYRKITSPIPFIHRIHQYNPDIFYAGQYDNVFDLYDKDRDKFFTWISRYERMNRDLEQILVNAGKQYEYFDLDNDSYCDVFGFKSPLKKDFSRPVFNLEDPIVRKKYNKALDMCQDYIDTFNLTDSRLEYRAKDGI